MEGQETVSGAMQRSGPEPERPPCKHCSIRLDSWVDAHCLLCGEAGYWVDGELIAASSVDAIAKGHATRSHPGGKTLISQGSSLDGESHVPEG